MGRICLILLTTALVAALFPTSGGAEQRRNGQAVEEERVSAGGQVLDRCGARCRKRRLLRDTYGFTRNYADGRVNCNGSFFPCIQWFYAARSDCRRVQYKVGRCLIYLYQWEYGTGYGYGGYDLGVYREFFFATRIGTSASGRRVYNTKPSFIDFLDPYYWVCSDTPRSGVPACAGNYYRRSAQPQ